MKDLENHMVMNNYDPEEETIYIIVDKITFYSYGNIVRELKDVVCKVEYYQDEYEAIDLEVERLARELGVEYDVYDATPSKECDQYGGKL